MAETLSCNIVTPVKTIFTGEATYVGLPGKAGGFGVMKNHEPLVSTLGPGVVSIKDAGTGKSSEVRYLVSGGYAEITDNHVIVLADRAVEAAAIDASNVRAKLESVEAGLAGHAEGDPARAYYAGEKSWLELQLKLVSSAE